MFWCGCCLSYNQEKNQQVQPENIHEMPVSSHYFYRHRTVLFHTAEERSAEHDHQRNHTTDYVDGVQTEDHIQELSRA